MIFHVGTRISYRRKQISIPETDAVDLKTSFILKNASALFDFYCSCVNGLTPGIPGYVLIQYSVLLEACWHFIS